MLGQPHHDNTTKNKKKKETPFVSADKITDLKNLATTLVLQGFPDPPPEGFPDALTMC